MEEILIGSNVGFAGIEEGSSIARMLASGEVVGEEALVVATVDEGYEESVPVGGNGNSSGGGMGRMLVVPC